MNTCFLDTSIVVDLRRNRASALSLTEKFEETLLSFTVWGELIVGVRKAFNQEAEMEKLERLFAKDQIIGADQGTAYICGQLLADLERRGRRIPTNDIWIAATAVQFDLPLLARDGHFGRLPQLRWVAY